MSIKKVKEHNSQQFLDDLKRVRTVMVFAPNTGTFLTITKKELLKEAENIHIKYHINDKIFKIKRDVMVIM